ncbi:MAG: hypothetical protein R6W95_14690 [Desulfosarcina sp.]
MAAVAANKQIHLEKLEVRVSPRIEEGKPWQTDFDIDLDLGGGLDPRQRTILSRCAGMCEVSKLLTGTIRFNYHFSA